MVILQMPPQSLHNVTFCMKQNFALCADGKKSAAVAAVDEGSVLAEDRRVTAHGV